MSGLMQRDFIPKYEDFHRFLLPYAFLKDIKELVILHAVYSMDKTHHTANSRMNG